MCPPKLLRCPCGTNQRPEPHRRYTGSMLISMRCPACGRRGFARRPETADEGWNERVQADRATSSGETGNKDEADR